MEKSIKKEILVGTLLSTLALSMAVPVLASETGTIIGNPDSTVSTEQPSDNGVVIVEPSTPSSLETIKSDGGTTIGDNEATVPKESTSDSGIVISDTPASTEVLPSTSSDSTVTSSTELAPSSSTETNSESIPSSSNNQLSSSSSAISQPSVTESEQSKATLTSPIITETGYKIVGTQDSNVIIETAEGKSEVRSASEVGATIKSDQKVEVKTKEGKLVQLPSTGEKSGIWNIFVGAVILLGVAAYKFKDKLKTFFKRNK